MFRDTCAASRGIGGGRQGASSLDAVRLWGRSCEQRREPVVLDAFAVGAGPHVPALRGGRKESCRPASRGDLRARARLTDPSGTPALHGEQHFQRNCPSGD